MDSSLNSPETSLESGMMSIPDSNTDSLVYDIPAQLSPVIDAVACRLIRGFRDRACPQSSSSDPAAGFGAVPLNTRPQGEAEQSHGQAGPRTSSAARKTTLAKISPSGGKRTARDEDGTEDGNDGQGGAPPPKKPCRAPELPANKSLACPFWKLNRVRHHKCLKRESF